jgi:hypothetical protein
MLIRGENYRRAAGGLLSDRVGFDLGSRMDEAHALTASE